MESREIKKDHDEFRRILSKMEKTTETKWASGKKLLLISRDTLRPPCGRRRDALSSNGKERRSEKYGPGFDREHRAMIILLDDLEVSGWDYKFWRIGFGRQGDYCSTLEEGRENDYTSYVRLFLSERDWWTELGFDTVRKERSTPTEEIYG